MKITASNGKPFQDFVDMVRSWTWLGKCNQDQLVDGANRLARDAFERGIEEGKRQCRSPRTKRSTS